MLQKSTESPMIGETPWSDGQKEVILRRVRCGAMGFMPIHAASDACVGWPDYGCLVGARFDGHPWTQEFTIEVVDGGHPGHAALRAPMAAY